MKNLALNSLCFLDRPFVRRSLIQPHHVASLPESNQSFCQPGRKRGEPVLFFLPSSVAAGRNSHPILPLSLGHHQEPLAQPLTYRIRITLRTLVRLKTALIEIGDTLWKSSLQNAWEPFPVSSASIWIPGQAGQQRKRNRKINSCNGSFGLQAC